MAFPDLGAFLGAPFRINAPTAFTPPAAAPPAAAPRGRAGSSQQGDLYFSRLVKLIPSEVVGLFLTFRESAASFPGVWATICLMLVLVLRTLGNRQTGQSIQIGAVAISAVSFILWVYAMGGNFLGIEFPPVPGVIPVSIGVWTFVVPLFYKGDQPHTLKHLESRSLLGDRSLDKQFVQRLRDALKVIQSLQDPLQVLRPGRHKCLMRDP